MTLDPTLRHGRLKPDDPQDNYAAARLIRDLTDQMNGADNYLRAKHDADQILHPDLGVLARLSEFFEAAAEQAQASESDEGWELHYRFADAASTLTDLRDDLDDSAEELRALGPSKPPHIHEATTQNRSTSPAPPAASARPASPPHCAQPPRRHR
ncbi:hypothetical protein [Streptomyces decoyicus]|uniref:hypothetical protein n=1 Tax=Streptomyces decoyicus TaxID=249567 RepID=UPI00386A10F4